MNPKVVQERLGHRNVSLTLQVYRRCCLVCRRRPPSWSPAEALLVKIQKRQNPCTARNQRHAGVAEMEDAPGLGPGGHSPWGFESLHPHPLRA